MSPQESPPRCAVCGDLLQPSHHGSPRRYCCQEHRRQAAHQRELICRRDCRRQGRERRIAALLAVAREARQVVVGRDPGSRLPVLLARLGEEWPEWLALAGRER